MAVLCFQSSVVVGHVGNRAAALPLQRLGIEPWCIDTVQFSNHPAYGGHNGRVVPPGEVVALLDGVARLGVLSRCRAVLSGYLGDAGTGPVVLDAVARIRDACPRALYLCDPVMGDGGRLYVADGVVDFLRTRAVPAADIATPNAFEAELLTGIAVRTPEDARDAARAIRGRGPKIAVVTGLRLGDRLGAVLQVEGASWIVESPAIAAAGHGAGDLFAAVFLGRLLGGLTPLAALEAAVASVHGVLQIAAGRGATDLALVAAQEAIVAPTSVFPARRL